MVEDEKLVAQFFEEHRQEIADDGFSHRVMSHIEPRMRRYNRVWSLVCAALGVALLLLTGCLKSLPTLMSHVAAGLWTTLGGIHFTPISPALAFFGVIVIMLVVAYNFLLSDKYSL